MTAPRQGIAATRHARRTTELSPTQRAIAACLLDALTDLEISEAVGIQSESAVKSHILRMRDKLQARNRTHLALILDRQVRA
jgi:DNA-binding CsgD family transcriptional regulator